MKLIRLSDFVPARLNRTEKGGKEISGVAGGRKETCTTVTLSHQIIERSPRTIGGYIGLLGNAGRLLQGKIGERETD